MKLDGIMLVVLFVLMTMVPCVIFKLWYWLILWACIMVLVIIIEIVAKKYTGHKISTHFRDLIKRNKTAAIITGSLWVGYMVYVLVVHLFMGF